MKHIFLTGDKQVGKSTIIKKFLKELNFCPAGFSTVWQKNTLFMISIDGSVKEIVATRTKNKININESVFDTIGLKLVQDSNNAALTVFDELGFIENVSPNFIEAVLERLNNTHPIIGVIKKADTPFLTAVKNHPNVNVINITENNREKIYSYILLKIVKLNNA